MTNVLKVSEVQVKEVLDAINDEYYHSIYQTKSDLILKAAKKLEEIDLPKEMIAGRLVKHINFAKERTIYKILGSDYKRSYESALSADIDDNNAIEEDAKAVKEKYNITDDDEPMTEARYYHLKEQILDLKAERDHWKNECIHWKTLCEAGQKSGAFTSDITHDVALHADEYEAAWAMMKKSPNGILIVHDGYNASKFKPLKFKRPTVGIEN